MAETQLSSLSFDQDAWNRAAYFALRPQLYFDQVADVRPTEQAMPGTAVKFVIVDDLSANTTELTETSDITPTAMGDSTVTLTLKEYGDAVRTTAKLRGTSFVDLDPVVADVVGYQAGLSLDTLARTTLQAGDNVNYATGGSPDPGSRAAIEADNTITAADVRKQYAELRTANAMDIGGLYTAYAHPYVAVDLRAETGAAAWRDPHTYSQPSEIWTGEVGSFEGFRFIETPRAPVFADTGSPSTVDVYATIFTARQALAKAHSYTDGNGPFPKIVPGPVTDILRRFVPIGWHWLGAYGRFREDCLRRVESATSLGS